MRVRWGGGEGGKGTHIVSSVDIRAYEGDVVQTPLVDDKVADCGQTDTAQPPGPSHTHT